MRKFKNKFVSVTTYNGEVYEGFLYRNRFFSIDMMSIDNEEFSLKKKYVVSIMLGKSEEKDNGRLTQTLLASSPKKQDQAGPVGAPIDYFLNREDPSNVFSMNAHQEIPIDKTKAPSFERKTEKNDTGK